MIKGLTDDLRRKLEENPAIEIFIRKRNKFEGWLKIELVSSLIQLGVNSKRIFPEREKIDVVFEHNGLKYAIELKTVNTSYRTEGVEEGTKPITKNIESLIKDIGKLRNTSYDGKLAIFIVFPLPENSLRRWQQHFDKVSKYGDIKEKELSFHGVPAKLYLLEVI